MAIVVLTCSTITTLKIRRNIRERKKTNRTSTRVGVLLIELVSDKTRNKPQVLSHLLMPLAFTS